MIITQCKNKECINIIYTYPSLIKEGRGKFCSRKCANLSYMKGDATYNTIHHWLHDNYGSAIRCESLKCKRKSKQFDWALIKGKKYEHNRNNFKQLCRSCHLIYDRHKKGYIMPEETKRKISLALKGKPRSW